MKYFSFFLYVFLGLNALSQRTIGLFVNNSSSYDGYTLFAPIGSHQTFLIDNCGREVHTWTSDYTPGQASYFLPNGSLLRAGNALNNFFSSAGKGGVIETFDWDNNVIWKYFISNQIECAHHDIKALPNGNILAIVWEKIPLTEVIAAGRNPANIGAEFHSEKIVEIQPVGTDSGIVVWEWHVFDHLIQHYDSTKENYGVIPAHPELINLNFNTNINPDWIHMNAIAFNEELDQIILSAHNFNEIWVIDHSTTSTEAASHSGGNCGKGGDLLYRWGNPAAYGRGTLPNGGKKLFGQHDAQWIPQGFNNGGKIILYNNGIARPAGLFSTIEIINPPLLPDGNYLINTGEAFGPATTDYTYPQVPDLSFYSSSISGVQPLLNGNLLICQGDDGKFFEIDSNSQIVWEYINPIINSGAMTQGTPPINNHVFKIKRYVADYSGFSGHNLVSGQLLELNPLPDTCLIYSTIISKEKDGFVEIYPNPAHGFFTVRFTDTKTHKVQIYNSIGGKVREMLLNNKVVISTGNFKQGIYFVKVDNVITKKLIVY